MKKLKILNLYAGIGGNRKLWGNNHEITAIENKKEIADIYQEFFPNDKVIVADAHKYLLEHYREFDFIWSSPPCPTHSGVNYFLNAQGCIRYPDMGLWQEIVFLEHFCKTKWVVENVKSYYKPLYPPMLLDRHYFWANFSITNWKNIKKKGLNITLLNTKASTRIEQKVVIDDLQEYHGFNLTDYKIKDKRRLLANCVYPPLGLHIFNEAQREQQSLI